MNAPNVDTVWLSRQQLADRWQMPEATLRVYAVRGDGPPFAKLGRHVRYALADILEFEAAAYANKARTA